MNPLRNLFNRFVWDKNFPSEKIEIRYISRGAPNNYESLLGTDVIKVFSRGFEYKTSDGKRKYIPFHRVILIKNKVSGEILYRSVKS